MFRRSFLLFLPYLLWLTACHSTGRDETTVQPASAGNISLVDSLVMAEIDTGNLPGAVVRIQRGDTVWHFKAYGYARKYSFGLKEADSPEKMSTHHLFDLASLTKVFATTFGIMLLCEEGLVELDEPIHTYLPEFKKEEKREITVRHLLSHSAGLPQWFPLYYKASDRKERYQVITEMRLKWPVGESRHYSDLGFMLLGDLIEQRTGLLLQQYLDKKLYRPLRLGRTIFNPLKKGFDASEIAGTSHGNPFEKRMVYDDSFGYKVDVNPDSWSGWRTYTLQGEVNDGNAWYANGGVAGHAGLFSTADELQVLIEVLLNNGKAGDREIISEATVDTFLSRNKYGNGLGWAMDKQVISARGTPSSTFGHTGFTGTSVVVMPEYDLSIILLTNRQNAGLQEDGTYFDLGPLRQDITDAVLNRIKVSMKERS